MLTYGERHFSAEQTLGGLLSTLGQDTGDLPPFIEAQPRPAEVSPAQAQRDGLEDLDRSYPAARRRADEEVLKLLGLLEPSVDLRKVSASIFGEGVAGYYDPRNGRLRIVRGAQTADRVLNEITLAHELTHALEDLSLIHI